MLADAAGYKVLGHLLIVMLEVEHVLVQFSLRLFFPDVYPIWIGSQVLIDSASNVELGLRLSIC